MFPQGGRYEASVPHSGVKAELPFLSTHCPPVVACWQGIDSSVSMSSLQPFPGNGASGFNGWLKMLHHPIFLFLDSMAPTAPCIWLVTFNDSLTIGWGRQMGELRNKTS